jgi:hypothetical protein
MWYGAFKLPIEATEREASDSLGTAPRRQETTRIINWVWDGWPVRDANYPRGKYYLGKRKNLQDRKNKHIDKFKRGLIRQRINGAVYSKANIASEPRNNIGKIGRMIVAEVSNYQYRFRIK